MKIEKILKKLLYYKKFGILSNIFQSENFENSWNLWKKISKFLKWSISCDWANPIRERFRDGIIPARAAKPRVHGIENSQQVTKGTSQFPKNGLAGVMKYKIPHERRSREWGIYILSQLLSHEWGIGKYLEWRVGNLPSLYLSLMGFTLPLTKWKFQTKIMPMYHIFSYFTFP